MIANMLRYTSLSDLMIKYDFQPKGVISVGAGEGQDAGVFHELGVQKVVWVEARSEACAALMSKLSGQGHIVINELAWDSVQMVNFNVLEGNLSASSPLLPDLKQLKLPQQQLSVRSVVAQPLDFILEQSCIDLLDYDTLVLDCQGSECNVIVGAGRTLQNIQFLFTEVWKSQGYKGLLTVRKLDKLLPDFHRVETFWKEDRCWGWSLYVRKSTYGLAPKDWEV